MVLPVANSDDTSASELRAASRTHLFVVATLSVGPTLMSVHIRNLSASGALIEGSALPAVGAVVSIRRASLSVEGVLVWRSRNQAGVAFKSNIHVPAWLPGNRNSRQSVVDKVVFDAKNGSARSSDQSQSNDTLTGPALAFAELASLRNDLTTLGDALVQDVILVATHPEIQILDVAMQRIDRLIALMAAPDRKKT